MTRFWQNDKVYAKLGENLIAAIVLEVSPSAPGQADLVWLRIAVRNPYFADRWIISDYPEPVWSTELSVREVPPLIAGLDE